MKYGVVMHTTTKNFGDDVQVYAAMKLLPQVDYFITRENINSFHSKNNEPVAVLMAAWWMWEKWNWPPAECIYPLMTSMHINNYGIDRHGTPIKEQWLKGIGGEYFRAYGPVGCRDDATLAFLQSAGIDSYFSGCLTLTLPKQKKTADAGTYVCLVDLPSALEKKAKEYLKDSGLEIRVMSHNCDYTSNEEVFAKRMANVEKVLTVYQNAKLVITRRLHVALPCLAMETPVIALPNMATPSAQTRWNMYLKWANYVPKKDFLESNFSYDFKNPPANNTGYLKIREALLASVEQFVSKTRDCHLTTEKLKKTTYTQNEVKDWQINLMSWALSTWRKANPEIVRERNTLRKECNKLQKIANKSKIK